ncbi:MAG: hypothetical protein HQM13_22585 [SAR324 cluster bacterium]|nr:hypothetical protein [SAR324 cluster bacterium]
MLHPIQPPLMGHLKKHCLIFIITITTALSSAAEAVILMESSIGFSDTFQVRKWTPFSVTLENRGKLIYGTLQIVVRSGNEYKKNLAESVYQQKVELPANSRKKYQFTLFIPSSVHPLKINLLENGKNLREETFSLKHHFTEKSMVLILGEKGNSYLFKQPADFSKPLSVRSQELPESWFGYDGVDSVVLQDSVLKNLNKPQLEALAQWIQNGGFLILSGGINYSIFADEKIKNLVSIEVLGLKRVSRLDALQEFSGHAFESKSPFLILETRIPGSQPLLTENEIPLVAEKTSGAGRILFLSFDFQSSLFQGWSGNAYFWDWLKKFQPPQEPSFIKLKERDILHALVTSISAEFPASSLIFLFFILYGLAARFFFMKIQNGQRQNILISGVFGSCILGSIIYFNFAHLNEVQHSRFTLLSKHGQSRSVHAQQWVAVYSFSETTDYIETEIQPFRLLESGYSKDLKSEPFVLEEENQQQRLHLPTRRWSHQFLKTKSSHQQTLDALVSGDGENLKIVIENQTSFDIKNGLIYYLKRLIRIGTIPSKKRKIIEFKTNQINQYEILKADTIGTMASALMPQNAHGFFNKFQRNLMERILDSLWTNYSPKKDSVLLIGWIKPDSGKTGKEMSGVHLDQIAMLEWEIRPIPSP